MIKFITKVPLVFCEHDQGWIFIPLAKPYTTTRGRWHKVRVDPGYVVDPTERPAPWFVVLSKSMKQCILIVEDHPSPGAPSVTWNEVSVPLLLVEKALNDLSKNKEKS